MDRERTGSVVRARCLIGCERITMRCLAARRRERRRLETAPLIDDRAAGSPIG